MAADPARRRATYEGVLAVPRYAHAGVKHVWLVDLIARTLEVLRLAGPHSLIVGIYADDERVRAEPFDAIELDLSVLWADVQL